MFASQTVVAISQIFKIELGKVQNNCLDLQVWPIDIDGKQGFHRLFFKYSSRLLNQVRAIY